MLGPCGIAYWRFRESELRCCRSWRAHCAGPHVLREVRNMPNLAGVPVVILTSSASPTDIHRTALLGASRFISKPSGLEDFLREVGGGVEEMLLASGW